MHLLETEKWIDGCPGPQTLAALSTGLLPGVQIDEASQHLDHCPRCAASLATIDARAMDTDPACVELRHFSHVDVAEPAGTRFGPFILQEERRAGGMGVVHKAWQVSLKRYVAIKKLKPDNDRAARMIKFLQAEGPAAARVKHEHVVEIYDCARVDDQPYLCMEWMDGGSLDVWMQTRPVSPRQAGDIVHKLAQAVQNAHEAGLVHCDLKPANVLMTKDGVPK